MLELDQGKILCIQKRVRHKAKGYMIEEGKLWRIGDGSDMAKPRLECITKEETVNLPGKNIAIAEISIETTSK